MTTMYDVTITAINKSSPADGSVDPFSIEYYRALPGASDGDTFANMTTRRKGHIRWSKIENQFSTLGNLYISNKVSTGGTTNAIPSSISFRITVEHGSDSLVTPDENNAGVMLLGALAIKRAIARALITSRVANYDVWDPAKVASTNVEVFGYRIVSVNTAAAAASISESDGHVTITAVD
jgi:hypothetical protein